MILGSPLSPLENILRHVLDWLGPNGAIGLPWSWSIVALTLIVRVILVPLTVRQIHSMQAMQAHTPQMKEIQKKYKNDSTKRNEELMKFYKENNINPASSCLPTVAQFPVFISLYFVLRNFSRHVPAGSDLSWLGFVPDIAAKASTHWSGYVLIVVYAGSQLASSYFMSTTMEKSQRTLLLLMPLVFIVVAVRFPVGLVLYWMTTNLWTVGQGVVTRRLVPKTPAPSFKRSSRTDGNGAAEPPARSEPKPSAAAVAPPRKVKRKKKARR